MSVWPFDHDGTDSGDDTEDDAPGTPYRGGGRSAGDPRRTDPRYTTADRLRSPGTLAERIIADAAAASGHPQCADCGSSATTAVATGKTVDSLRPYCDDCSLAALAGGGREFGLPSYARALSEDDRWKAQATADTWTSSGTRVVSLTPTDAATALGVAVTAHATATAGYVDLSENE